MLFPSLVSAIQSVMTHLSNEFTLPEREVIHRFVRICKINNPFSSENIEDITSLVILMDILDRVYDLEREGEPDLGYFHGEVMDDIMEVKKKIHHCLARPAEE